MPFALSPRSTNERSLDAAVKAAAEVLNKAVKPVLVGGVKMRWPGKAQHAFLNLAEAGQYPVAMQPSAKGFFPESHERYALCSCKIRLQVPGHVLGTGQHTVLCCILSRDFTIQHAMVLLQPLNELHV